jgi:beta-fructofuranosidase
LKQADVEVDFELTSIDNADPFDPSWLLDVEKHCREAGASVQGGIGPFGLVVLASDNMEEHTAVHFRVYKSQQSYMILMCSDLRRSVHMVFFLIFLSLKISKYIFAQKYFISLHRSSLRPGMYTPAYGGFFEFDLQKERKISLRTLVSWEALSFLLLFTLCSSCQN